MNMKKKIWIIVLASVAAIALIVTAVIALSSGDTKNSWQEQYDLGMRYLNEGNYEEAIIAFTAAIEIDPRNPNLYVSRANAYAEMGDLASARADYETALELDDTLDEAWMKLADTLLAQGNTEEAVEVLQNGIDRTGGNQEMEELLHSIEKEENNLPDFTPDEKFPRVYVSNTDELNDALEHYKSDVVIVLKEGDYIYDWALYLSNLSNVTMQADGKVRIMTTSGDDEVLILNDCSDITIDGITLGHDPAVVYGGCNIGVIKIYCQPEENNLAQINIIDCDIFGCGFLGIQSNGNGSLTVVNTTIRDCSGPALELSYDANFYNCKFSGNGYRSPEYEMITAWSALVHFYNCTFEKNHNFELLYDNSELSFGGSCEFVDCVFYDNAWGD